MTTAVILQPSYLPWRGFFHLIEKADVFVHYDDAQYDKHGWRNRNRVKTANGTVWISVPVLSRGVVVNHTPISEARIDWTQNWSKKHWDTIRFAYKRAPFFDRYEAMLQPHF